MERFYLAALLAGENIGSATVSKLVDYFGGAKAAWQKSSDAELKAAGLDAKKIASLNKFRREQPDYPEKLADYCAKSGVQVLTLDGDDYPPLLKEIFSPPSVLYCRGKLNNEAPHIGIVGSRRQTPYGKKAADFLARGLAQRGVVIVSGAAYGIDATAHAGALSVKDGNTVAVLGCGIDIAYPPTHRKLLDEIAERGAVLSEYPISSPPIAQHFPLRNRIISGLCCGVIVVEAAERSGSLITAEHAISDNRDVFAVPGSIFSPLSGGTNKLISQGAKLVRNVDDVLNEYPWGKAAAGNGKNTAEKSDGPQLTDEEKTVCKLLSPDEPRSIDDVINSLHGKADVSNIAFILMQLTLKGVVSVDDDNNYMLS